MSHDTAAAPDPILDGMRTLAKICGLRQDFLSDLLMLERDDWSFVIKAHALLESVVCQLLATHLKQPAMEYVLAQNVQMEDRIVMMKALGIADDNERRMMRLLGKIRNNLVHNAEQTDFTFSEYFKNRDNRRNFTQAFATEWPDTIGTTRPINRSDYILQNPRYAIWVSVMQIVSHTFNAKLKALYAAKQEAILEALRQAGEPAQPDASGGN